VRASQKTLVAKIDAEIGVAEIDARGRDRCGGGSAEDGVLEHWSNKLVGLRRRAIYRGTASAPGNVAVAHHALSKRCVG